MLLLQTGFRTLPVVAMKLPWMQNASFSQASDPSSRPVSTQTHLAQILNQAGKELDLEVIPLVETESITAPDWPGT